MVLGSKTQNRKSQSIQLDYIINLVEIRPWPPSQSLRSLRSALIQWEHGDKCSGSTKTVAPSILSSKIEFNESFRVHVTLSRDMSIKSGENETFLRNCIEFNMYESRRDKTVKGQLLASATMDFAEYGIVEESLIISLPMNCKRTFGNSAQPMLFVKIHKNNRVRSMEKNRSESVSALMNEEYAEEAETASVTDDDIFSQSSKGAGSSSFGSNGDATPVINDQEVLVQDKMAAGSFHEECILSSSDLYSELENTHTTFSRFTIPTKKDASFSMKPSNSSIPDDRTSKELKPNSRNKLYVNLHEKDANATQSGQKSQIIRDFGSDADTLKNMKPLGSSPDSGITKILEKFKNAGVVDQNNGSNDRKVKVKHLEQRIQILEGELREAAAIEVSLYSVVAEHGCSVNKVHAPARRLSRLYLHEFKENSRSMRAHTGKSIVSGLILVSKACGNDVPRLTFWLSNCVVLRAIIYETNSRIVGKGDDEIISPLKWKKEFDSKGWDDPRIVSSVLKKVESWIFSRIIDSIWWQTLAPYMSLSRVVESFSRDDYFLELWKKAFMDAYERICPVRAAGHDCGCFPMLSKLIMEELMARLDVAMFNAILRDSIDEVSVDPVNDPITDVRVLPIPSGKASFGAGAQLKKTIGNWSRWLTDLLGIENKPLTSENEPDYDTSFDSFRLLIALSELMMLPKDMLLSHTIRKEVCPSFGVALIKRILDSFVPDEFCPDPIPDVVLRALDSEDLIECGEDCVTSLPCAAPPIVYRSPSTSSIRSFLEHSRTRPHFSRNGSSILKKSNTSDDELDELDSPLTLINDSSRTASASIKPIWPLKDAGSCNTIRYQLLKDVWRNSE